ncbi:MAG: OmpA family protein [Candidatus Omnitrophica bacterium]|nr:OmpA family protein [Candidatus Omnitrophota bacterium]
MRRRAFLLLITFIFFINGCAVIFQKGRSSDIQKIENLKSEVDELKEAKELLEGKLSKEIKDKQVRLDMAEKGLVITFVAEILFDSGKAKLREESFPILEKVANILVEKVPENSIGVEGHTDNEPIKYSRWASNWELSTQRALSVLYYLNENGVKPQKLSAVGYGEYQPVASNDTAEGRQLNRRVEIVILPRSVRKASESSSSMHEDSDWESDQEEYK